MDEVRRGKVTIVTTDRTTQHSVESALEHAGLEPLRAPSGLKLLSVLFVDEPDAIVLDLDTPWTDAVLLCRAIHNRPERTAIPIFCVGASSSPERRRECLAAGATAVLTKPVDTPALIQHLSAAGLHSDESRRAPEPP